MPDGHGRQALTGQKKVAAGQQPAAAKANPKAGQSFIAGQNAR